MPDGIVDHARREEPRLIHEQGHAQRGVVGKEPVRELAVLAQGLAMIASDDDQRAPGCTLIEDRRDKGRKGGIRRTSEGRDPARFRDSTGSLETS